MASPSEPTLGLRAFRIADTRHSLLDGEGAYLKGGRWNSPGRRVIYAAETYAGALLETLVHANFDELPDTYGWIEIRVPDADVEELGPDRIAGWNSDDFTSTRELGDRWHEQGRTLALLVPSVVTAGVERNVLINQDHPNFRALRSSEVRELMWDKRLFRR